MNTHAQLLSLGNAKLLIGFPPQAGDVARRHAALVNGVPNIEKSDKTPPKVFCSP